MTTTRRRRFVTLRLNLLVDKMHLDEGWKPGGETASFVRSFVRCPSLPRGEKSNKVRTFRLGEGKTVRWFKSRRTDRWISSSMSDFKSVQSRSCQRRIALDWI